MAPSFLSKNCVSYPIDFGDAQPVTVRFWPVRIRKLLTLRSMAAIVVKAINSLATRSTLELRKHTTIKNLTGEQQTVVEPMTEEASTLWVKDREGALAGLVDVMLDEANVLVMAELLIDSMRTESPTQDPKEFLDVVDAAVLPQLFVGFMKANQKILGPLEGPMRGALIKSGFSQPQASADGPTPSPEPKEVEPSKPD